MLGLINKHQETMQNGLFPGAGSDRHPEALTFRYSSENKVPSDAAWSAVHPTVPSTEINSAIGGRLFEQSVTLHAYMEGYGPRTTGGSTAETGWFLLGITQAQLPIVVGAVAGGLVLLFTLLGIVAWRICQRRIGKESQYSFQSCDEVGHRRVSCNQNVIKTSNDAVVYINTVKPSNSSSMDGHHPPDEEQNSINHHKNNHNHNSNHRHHHHHHHHHHRHRDREQRSSPEAVATTTGSETESPVTPSIISRSQSAPLKNKKDSKSQSSKKRPQSQPSACCSSSDIGDYQQIKISQEPGNSKLLPDIPEIRLQSSDTLDGSEQHFYYSTYDHPATKRKLQMDVSSATLKTRSLPTWVRSRPRPQSTEDDVNELYAKVEFNKKRKNRMCNDSAAAIALNKSRSQFIHFPFMHKDTDSLVDNEAIVVFDERTAL